VRLELLDVALVGVSGYWHAWRLWWRLAVSLRNIEDRQGPKEHDALSGLLAPLVALLDAHRRHDADRTLTLADLPAELLPCLETRDLRRLGALHGDQRAIAPAAAMERRAGFGRRHPSLLSSARVARSTAACCSLRLACLYSARRSAVNFRPLRAIVLLDVGAFSCVRLPVRSRDAGAFT
jgi:hypothetical protein